VLHVDFLTFQHVARFLDQSVSKQKIEAKFYEVTATSWCFIFLIHSVYCDCLCLCWTVDVIMNPAKYFAHRLHQSLKVCPFQLIFCLCYLCNIPYFYLLKSIYNILCWRDKFCHGFSVFLSAQLLGRYIHVDEFFMKFLEMLGLEIRR